MPTQVIERHLITDLEEIFSPLTVSQLSDAEILRLVSEPEDVIKHRQILEDRKKVLEKGKAAFDGLFSKANGQVLCLIGENKC